MHDLANMAQIIHSPVHAGEYTIIIDLNVRRKYFKGREFCYDLTLINRKTGYYVVDLMVKFYLSTDSYDVFAKYNDNNTYISGDIKFYYSVTEDGDNVNFRVYANNQGQPYVYWEIKPNYLSNMYCEDSLLRLNNDIIKEADLPSTKTAINKFQFSETRSSYIYTDNIVSNSDANKNVKLNGNIIPSSHAYSLLGNKDNAFRGAWFSHYVKMPIQNKATVKSVTADKGITGTALMFCNSQDNRKLSFYDADTDKIRDVFGVTSDKQKELFTPTLLGAVTAGTATYTEQTGEIIRLGKLCIVNMRIKGTFDSTIDGYLYIDTPFTITTTNMFGGLNIMYQSGFGTGQMTGIYTNSRLELYKQNIDTGNSSNVKSIELRGNTFNLWCMAILLEK